MIFTCDNGENTHVFVRLAEKLATLKVVSAFDLDKCLKLHLETSFPLVFFFNPVFPLNIGCYKLLLLIKNTNNLLVIFFI